MQTAINTCASYIRYLLCSYVVAITRSFLYEVASELARCESTYIYYFNVNAMFYTHSYTQARIHNNIASYVKFFGWRYIAR